MGLFFWFLNRIFDDLDGTVTRMRGEQNDLDSYLDIVADFVIYVWLADKFNINLQYST